MKFDCEITNTTIVEPRGRYRGTIGISGEKVAGILAEPSGNAARTIDAEGLVAGQCGSARLTHSYRLIIVNCRAQWR